jgi:formylglycine-generating enzyme required for sulfatase activity
MSPGATDFIEVPSRHGRMGQAPDRLPSGGASIFRMPTRKEEGVSEGPNAGAFSWRNPIILTILLTALVLFAVQVVQVITTRNRLAQIDIDLEALSEQANVVRQQAEENGEQLAAAKQLLIASGERQEEILKRLKVVLDNDTARIKEAELNLQRWQMRWIKFHLAQSGCEPSEDLALLYDVQTRGAIGCWQESREETPTGFLSQASIHLLLQGPVTFRDCHDHCPAMALIPPGQFLMGSERSARDGKENEKPRHAVEIAYPFAAGAFEVTLAEWEACVDDGGCSSVPLERHEESETRKRPVTHVTWHEANAYADWLSARVGGDYRLLSESEWEYVARANTTTPFYSGESVSSEQANFDGKYDWRVGSALTADVYLGRTLEVGLLEANAFGLHDVHGNASEWTLDCYNSHYKEAPEDGRPRESESCIRRVVRGGSWKDKPWDIRSARRHADVPDKRTSQMGFRVMRTFTK